MLVTAILVALAGMAVFAYSAIQKNALQKTAHTEISTFVSACNMYHTSVNAYPQTLQDLKTVPQGMQKSDWGGPYLATDTGDLLDPWHHEYRYQPDESNDTVVITSAGPDGSMDTADDISNLPTSAVR